MNRLLVVGLAALALEIAPLLAAQAAIHSPEQDTLETAKLLRPISDDQWKTVAGERISEKYQFIKGDTLFDVSKRLFGDARYWPKLYALNNDTITNPHVIRPGNSIAFLPGTGSSLPAVTVAENEATHGPTASGSKATANDGPGASSSHRRSQDWRGLPHQAWEGQDAKLPENVDALGFDKDIHVNMAKPRGFDLEAISASERLTTLGQIIGSRSSGEYLTLGDTVYVRNDSDLQVGETYAITQEPTVLKSRKSDRMGLSYPILGKVKIIGVRDNQFIGSITTGRGFIFRGTTLIPNPQRVPELTPIPAAASTEGVVMVDRNFSTYTVAQHKMVFIDRGSTDGVKIGMVFRAYEHYDPSNEKRVTSSDFLIDADMIVMQVSDRFCTAVIIDSMGAINENSAVVLLTDVSDLLRSHKHHEKSLGDSQKDSELDDLDKLDGGEGLGKDEQRELEQLEKWKGNPPPAPELTPGPTPTDPAAAPADQAPPVAAPEPLAPPPLEAAPTETPPPPPELSTPEAAPPAPAEAPATAPVAPPAASTEPAPPPPPPPASSEESRALDGLLNQ